MVHFVGNFRYVMDVLDLAKLQLTVLIFSRATVFIAPSFELIRLSVKFRSCIVNLNMIFDCISVSVGFADVLKENLIVWISLHQPETNQRLGTTPKRNTFVLVEPS